MDEPVGEPVVLPVPETHRARPSRVVGVGRPSLRLFAVFVCLGVFFPLGSLKGLQVPGVELDTLWTGEDAVELQIPLDSLVVAPFLEMDSTSMLLLVKDVLPDAVHGRSTNGRARVYTFPARRREDLVLAARQIQGHPEIRWSGFLIRRAGREGTAMITDEFLVRFQLGLERAVVESMIRGWGAVVVLEPGFPGDNFVLRVTDASPGDALSVSHQAHLDPRVEYAQPNFVFAHRDASTGSGPPTTTQWHHSNIKTLGAWTTTKGSPDVVIAVIELGGFDTTHPDLSNQWWENPWEAGLAAGTEPLGTKPGDTHGWSFHGCDPGEDPLTSDCGTPTVSGDPNCHPTQVTGMAAGAENVAEGVSGVCPRCSVMPVRLGDSPEFDYDAKIRGAAIRYAYLQGASVINLSWNAFITDHVIRGAIADAGAHGRNELGATVINASQSFEPDLNAGIDHNICSGEDVALASVDSVIAVTESDVNDARRSAAMGFCLDLLAPGYQVKTTDPAGAAGESTTDYMEKNGNSFAVPVVSGVAGLMLSANPSLNRQQVYDILIDTADEVDNGGYGADGHSDTHGYGRVNAFAAVKSAYWAGISVVLPEPSPPWSSAFVIPLEWIFNYVSGDHHFNVHGIWVDDEEFHPGTGTLDWTTRATFADKNFDDDYWWEASHGVLALQDAFTAAGESPWMESPGGRQFDERGFQDSALAGFDDATVVLKGWQFDFADGDHHVKTVSIRLRDMVYDSETGSVEWRAEAELRDRTAGTDYRWRYQWQVIGIDDGEIVSVTREGADEGNTDLDEASESRASLRGFQNAVVLPQGWRFEYASSDHEINEHRFGIRNMGYDSGAGQVRWTATFNYSDKNFDDHYSWEYDVAAIAFTEGLRVYWWGGPLKDDGGPSQRSFSVQVRR